MIRLFDNILIPNRPDPQNAVRLDLAALPMTASMEYNGMRIDKTHMLNLHKQLTEEMGTLSAEVARLAGKEINIGSGDQLAELLFTDLKLKQAGKEKWTKSKARLAADSDVLRGMISQHACISPILKWKEREKLRSTYTHSLIAQADSSGRIHPDINHCGPETGRLSCVAHWTPIHTKRGIIPIKEVRIGDYVWTHRNRWRRVLAVLNQGIKHTHSIRFDNGNILTCTKSHRILQWEYEHIKEVAVSTNKYTNGNSIIPVKGLPYNSGSSFQVRNHIQYYTACLQDLSTTGGIQSIVQDSLFTFQTGREESHVWENWGTTPQLDRDGGRWAWVSDLCKRWEETVHTPNCDGRSTGVGDYSRYPGCTPHRRQQEEQQPGQFSFSYSEGAQTDPLSTAEGQSFCNIEKIKDQGCCEVYDLTVEEDESYLACGVFSHNCSNPNLQNIPIHGESGLGREIRNAFVPSPGMVMGTVDASQIEMRMMCHDAFCRGMLEIFWTWSDLYWGVAEDMYRRKFSEEERKHGIDPATGQTFKNYYRFNAKTTALGVTYAISPAGLVDLFLSSTPPAIGFLTDGGKTWDYDRDYDNALRICTKAILDFFEAYPEMLERRKEHHRRATKFGLVWDMWGRIRWIPQVKSTHRWIAEEGLRAAGNLAGQGGAAGIIKLWMAVMWKRIEEYWSKHGIRVLIAVHDEVVSEGPKNVMVDFLEESKYLLRNLLPADAFCVPLEGDSDYGERWGDLK